MPLTPKDVARLRVLVRRIDQWENVSEEDNLPSIMEELILDIKQCLESVLENA